MPIRTGKQLLESLRDGRQLFIDGERVADVTTDRALCRRGPQPRRALRHAARPGAGRPDDLRLADERRPVGLSFIEPRSVDDLIRRRDMVKIWMDATCGMFGRSPDFMNIFFTGFASAADDIRPSATSVRRQHPRLSRAVREHDICMTHTLVNPQVDRSRPVEQQDKDLAAKIVKETDAGIVIRGARMVSTLCAYADDLLVLPSTFLANQRGGGALRLRLQRPGRRAGLRFICRPSVMHQNAASLMDFPLSARFDETDAMVIFDDVLVPWERVFIHRDPELCNGLYNRTGICRRSCTSSRPRTWPRPSS